MLSKKWISRAPAPRGYAGNIYRAERQLVAPFTQLLGASRMARNDHCHGRRWRAGASRRSYFWRETSRRLIARDEATIEGHGAAVRRQLGPTRVGLSTPASRMDG